MTPDVEQLVRSTLAATPEVRCQVTGAAIRRLSHKRQRRAQLGTGAVVAAASVSIGIAIPRLVGTGSGGGDTLQSASPAQVADPSAQVGSSTMLTTEPPAATSAPPAAASAPPSVSQTAATEPAAGTADPCPADWQPDPGAPPARGWTPNATSLPPTDPQLADAWTPAGEFITDPTVQKGAPRVVAADCDWALWPDAGGELLDPATARVVYAGGALIDGSRPLSPRTLVVVRGRVIGANTPALAVLSTIAGGSESLRLDILTVIAVSTVPNQEAVAVAGGMAVFVVADGGVTKAEYIYRDATGDRVVAMDVDQGVATSLLAVGPDAPEHTITKVVAYQGSTKIWDGPPAKGR